MSSIDGYELTSAKSGKELSRLVSERLQNGWELYGDPFMGDGIIYQALILNKTPQKRLRKTTGDG